MNVFGFSHQVLKLATVSNHVEDHVNFVYLDILGAYVRYSRIIMSLEYGLICIPLQPLKNPTRTKHSRRTFTLKVDALIPNAITQPMYNIFCWLVGLHVHYLCKRKKNVHMIT